MKQSKHGIKLHQFTVPVIFLKGKVAIAGAQGSSASWMCICGHPTPLLGKCSVRLGRSCYTVCPECSRNYKVRAGLTGRTRTVEEIE
jgi:hypothetical protein